MNRIAILLVALIAFTFVACDPATSNVGEDKVDVGEAADLELLGFEWVRGEFGNRTLVGRIRNNTDKTYDYAQIQFNLFNAADEQVGSALANVNNLSGGTVWRFEAFVIEDTATRAVAADITGF